MSAVSNRLTPASRASLICLRAPSTSIWPTGDAHPVPPKPIVPRGIVETRKPLRPSFRYSIGYSSPGRRRVGAWFVSGRRRHGTVRVDAGFACTVAPGGPRWEDRLFQVLAGHPGLRRARLRLRAMDARSEIRDFLTSRRARMRPEDVGLKVFGPRRVPGLRREEVATLAGLSVDTTTGWSGAASARPLTRARRAGGRAAAPRGRAGSPVPPR